MDYLLAMVFFKKRKNSSNSLGTEAELWAQTFLEQQGLKTVTQNFRTPQGEIDLIMRDKNILVFVEVRLRSNSSHGGAKDSINYVKQQRLTKAARSYLQAEDLWDRIQCRFDALCLDKNPNNNQYQVEWIRNAFSAST